MIIKLSTNYDHPLVQQVPGGQAKWKDATFMINTEVAECDAWIVHEGLMHKERTRCPASRVFLLTGEPPEIKAYDSAWLAGFARVITCHRNLAHRSVVHSQTALPWLVGRSYDELSGVGFPEKERDISVICSNKAMTSGHLQRMEFVERLLPLSPMTRFGRGFHDLPDKWHGLAPFRYSVAIENSSHPHYWTEKISDCFLAGTVPIYWGAPNIADYFPMDAMIILRSLDHEEAAQVIRVEATAEAYIHRMGALREAKRRILEEYNLFEVAYQLANDGQGRGAVTEVALSPEASPPEASPPEASLPPLGWRGRIKQVLGRARKTL